MLEAVGSFAQIKDSSNPRLGQLPAALANTVGASLTGGLLGLHFPALEPGWGSMPEGQFHVILTTGLTGLLLVAVLVLLCYFTCRLAASLPLGGPGMF